ncbi:MAG: NAD-dependent epimerase/dehydratase family protein, partial [Deltaproteobacteria bacterium]|nr:NAD-dependent epimerase/dehydratase family protein [Deltaproteobacteria bacterium]
MARVLITGSNGFIGRRLSKELLDMGHKVRGAVRSEAAKNALQPGIEPVVAG